VILTATAEAEKEEQQSGEDHPHVP
jgi:hypothetical protein